MDDEDDLKFVERCLAGDACAFEEIVDKYQKPVFRLAIRMVKDYDDAEDVTQSIFIKIYENLDAFNPKYRFFSWLYRIAINETINFCKKKSRVESLSGKILVNETGLEEDFYKQELNEKVQFALLKVDIFYRLPLVLKHFLDYSYKEISEILEVPEKTVKSRLYTARQLLKDILLGIGIEQND